MNIIFLDFMMLQYFLWAHIALRMGYEWAYLRLFFEIEAIASK